MDIAHLTEHEVTDIRNRLFAQSLKGNPIVAKVVADLDACSTHGERLAVLELWREEVTAQFKQLFASLSATLAQSQEGDITS